MGSGASAATDSAASRAAIDTMYEEYAATAATQGNVWPGIDAETILASSEPETGAKAAPWQDRFLFIDTRTSFERDVSQLPGAISPSEFETMIQYGPSGLGGKQPVAYCTIGYRSGKYCAKINTGATFKGAVKILNLKGSILAWIHAGGPLLDKAGNPTKTVHVFGSKWDLAPDDYDTVRFPLM